MHRIVLLKMAASTLVMMWCYACFVGLVGADDPYRFLDWTVTYGSIYPLGVKQQGILINGQFPGPTIHSQTNDNLIINVHNQLDEPFLISWNGVQQRWNAWQDGVSGTNCPIAPGKNYTYVMQVKDQIGSFYYFPSLGFHKAAGGFGGLQIISRPRIPVPFSPPADDFTVLIGDWYKSDHKGLKLCSIGGDYRHGTAFHLTCNDSCSLGYQQTLQGILDGGGNLPSPDGVLLNGHRSNGDAFTVEQGKTYRFRVSNVGLQHTLNFRIQGHRMKLVEVEGTHTVQTIYSSIDVHVGQSMSVLVTASRPERDYYIAVNSRFTGATLTATGVMHYSNSVTKVLGRVPLPPKGQTRWSLNQAYSIRTNLTASGPRPNPQGSYHYGQVKIQKTYRMSSSTAILSGKQRYAVNSASYNPSDTPLKLADYLNISGIFQLGGIPDAPNGHEIYLDTSVIDAPYRGFVEFVFENKESTIQTWHLDGYAFWVVGMQGGQWDEASRASYNLRDAVSRSTTQVYPNSWTAILVSLDNAGMWNLRTQIWARQYLGQQLYLRVRSLSTKRDEKPIPHNVLLCGKATGHSI